MKEKFIVIPKSLRDDYGLKGNRLLIAGLIYGFSQDEESWFHGSVKYIANWIGASEQTVQTLLAEMTEEGIFERVEVNRKGSKREYHYRFIYDTKNSCRETAHDIKNSGRDDIKNSCRNNDNIDNNNIERKNIKKDRPDNVYNLDFVSEEMRPHFDEWLRYKREKGQTYKTEKTIKVCYDKLMKMSGGNTDVASEIISNSIANNYSGLFPLRNYGTNQQGTNCYSNGNAGKQERDRRFQEHIMRELATKAEDDGIIPF